MSKRARISQVEKWIKEGRGSGVGACYKPRLKSECLQKQSQLIY